MNKIRVYVVAQGENVIRLQDEVSKLIDKNFQPFGSMSILTYEVGNDCQAYEYNQPMVKYKEA